MGLQRIATDNFRIHRDRDAACFCMLAAYFGVQQWSIQLRVDPPCGDPSLLATPSKCSAKLVHDPDACGLSKVIWRQNVVGVLHSAIEFFQGVAPVERGRDVVQPRWR